MAELAKVTLAPNPKLDWTAWTGDYAKVRDAIAESYPQWFSDFNCKLGKPGGFYRANKARKRGLFRHQNRSSYVFPAEASYVVRIAVPDLPGSIWYKVAESVAAWWSARERRRAPSSMLAGKVAIGRREAGAAAESYRG